MSNKTPQSASLAATAVGLLGVALFTTLLIAGQIGEGIYFGLILGVGIVSLGVLGFSRLQELDLKNLRITLREIKDAQEKLEKTKAEIAEMYGGIENLKREPFVLDDQRMKELGLWGTNGLVSGGAQMRYAAGCIRRERERLAQVFSNEKSPHELQLPSSIARRIIWFSNGAGQRSHSTFRQNQPRNDNSGDLHDYTTHIREPLSIGKIKSKGLDSQKRSIGDRIVLVGLGQVVQALPWGANFPTRAMPYGNENCVMLRAFGKPVMAHPEYYEFAFMIRNWYVAEQ